MPTTQKSQQKQTKVTQKVGGSAKKPVTKAMEGGKVAPSKGKMTRGGSAKGGGISEKMPVTKKKFKEEIELLDNRINTFTTNITQINENIRSLQIHIAELYKAVRPENYQARKLSSKPSEENASSRYAQYETVPLRQVKPKR
jgi:chromosome segregation ATPase